MADLDLDLAQVRAFVLTAEHQHFSRAAEALLLSQQALSKRIRRLEDALATPLFVRTNRSVELTGAGARFLPHARALVDAADAAVAAVGGGDGPVRVDVVENRLAPLALLRALAQRDPALRVERSGRHGLGHALDPLLRGEIDLAFGRVHGIGRPLPDGLAHRLVRLEPLVALLPPEHPLAGVDAVRPADLRPEGVWLPSLDVPVEFRDFLTRMSAELDVPVDTSGNSFDLRHTLEQARYGKPRVTLVGADMDLPHDLNLRVLPFRPAPLFAWSVVWRTGRQRPAVRRLLALLDRTKREEDWCAHDPATGWQPDHQVRR